MVKPWQECRTIGPLLSQRFLLASAKAQPRGGFADFMLCRHIEEITMSSNRKLEDLEATHAKALQDYHHKVNTLESEIKNLENQLRKRDTSIHSKLHFLQRLS